MPLDKMKASLTNKQTNDARKVYLDAGKAAQEASKSVNKQNWRGNGSLSGSQSAMGNKAQAHEVSVSGTCKTYTTVCYSLTDAS